MLDLDLASLLGQLQRLADPRRRQGRRYPLASLLGPNVAKVLLVTPLYYDPTLSSFIAKIIGGSNNK